MSNESSVEQTATRKRSKHRRDKQNIAKRGAKGNRLAATILGVGIVAGIAVWQWPHALWGYKKAPSFTLQSSTGRAVSLEDFREKKKVVLIFYMSAG